MFGASSELASVMEFGFYRFCAAVWRNSMMVITTAIILQFYGLHFRVESEVKVRRNAAELSSGTYDFELSRVPAHSLGGNGVLPLLHVQLFMLLLHAVVQRKYQATG